MTYFHFKCWRAIAIRHVIYFNQFTDVRMCRRTFYQQQTTSFAKYMPVGCATAACIVSVYL